MTGQAGTVLQSAPILQPGLPAELCESLARDRLPGTRPCGAEDWIVADAAFAAQMALRDRLIAAVPGVVHAMDAAAAPAAAEVLDGVLAILGRRPGYRVRPDDVRRPDGVTVAIDRARPLPTLGRLVQEDLCLLQLGPAGHVLTGAILCFPASWSLAEKLGRPLTGIHAPVPEYDPELGRRVQRLFDAIRPGRPLQRANLLGYDDPALFQPRRETERRARPGAPPRYLRSERQCLVRLPVSGAVVFSIHTFVIRREDAPPELMHRA